ncbi:MAG: pyrroloquinoline quinone biosynthesis protein PqqB [Xanthobacteraceae bacterium]
MIAVVLGSAAGGGFPQWNCCCPVCRLAWAGDPRVKPRTQASIAVSADGERWLLINASPDLRAQISATPVLHPKADRRDSPIAAVILTGAEIDQTTGLLTLRERQPFRLLATAATHGFVAGNPMFSALQPDLVPRLTIVPGECFAPLPGIEAELFSVPGKVPLYLEGDHSKNEADVNVGVELRAGTARLVYVPGAAAVPAPIQDRLARADIVLFDGTLYRDDEMILTGTGEKTGRRMGHMPIDGPDGTLVTLAGLSGRRLFIHINNTNPILIEGSPERAHVTAAGWEVAEDGMEIAL